MKLDLLDVFANGALSGNPLAVVRGAEGLTTAWMQALAAWIGFSETTFLLPPSDAAADYAVRIFTPTHELPFAGHPTLGSAYAWLAAGGLAAREGVVVQECGVGLVPVRVAGARLAFRAPPLRREGALSAAEKGEALALLGLDESEVLDSVHVDNGPPWQLLRLGDVAALRALDVAGRGPGVDLGAIAPSDRAGVDWEVRGFFSKQGGVLAEDPVTGSLNAGVAQYLFASGLATGDYVATQGQAVGADGRVYVAHDAEGIWIGGDVTLVARDANLDF